MAAQQSPQADVDFLQGGGEAGALMRALDWSATPLGPPSTWPQSLRTAVRILLDSRYAMWMTWGDGFPFLYNDAYAPTLGSKHPQAISARIAVRRRIASRSRRRLRSTTTSSTTPSVSYSTQQSTASNRSYIKIATVPSERTQCIRVSG